MAPIYEMRSEESREAVLYVVTGVGYSSALNPESEKSLLRVIIASIIQAYAVRPGTVDWYYHQFSLVRTLKFQPRDRYRG